MKLLAIAIGLLGLLAAPPASAQDACPTFDLRETAVVSAVTAVTGPVDLPEPRTLPPGRYCADLQPLPEANGLLAAVQTAVPDARAVRPCTRFAVAGRDTLAGLVAALEPGETGCLTGDFTEKVTIDTPQITLKTDPRALEAARVRGRIQVDPGADDVWLDRLVIDGDNADQDLEIALQVFSTGFRLSNSELTTGHAADASSCSVFGGASGPARDLTIERNRVHGCGYPALRHDHGLYLAFVRGGVIRDNVFYDNAPGGWDMQLYPDADGLTIEHNTMDGGLGGIVLGGEGTRSSDGNRFAANVISHPMGEWAFQASWGERTGTDNVVSDTCVLAPVARGFAGPGDGYVVRGTVTADPGYVDPAARDYRLRAGSPCGDAGARLP